MQTDGVLPNNMCIPKRCQPLTLKKATQIFEAARRQWTFAEEVPLNIGCKAEQIFALDSFADAVSLPCAPCELSLKRLIQVCEVARTTKTFAEEVFALTN